MTQFKIYRLALLCLAWLLIAPAVAQAETYHTCAGFITSLPAVISTQGTWCFKQDLATAITSGDAISINTNNVTIDCNEFKLGGLGAGTATQTVGIHATDRLNASVRHCNIRGFYKGLLFEGIAGGGHAVEDNRFDGNTYIGLEVAGDGSVVRRNRVSDTGGSTVIAGTAYGVYTTYSVDVLNNTVSGVSASAGTNGNAFGFYNYADVSGRIIDNGVSGLVKDGTGTTFGIFTVGVVRLSIRGNDVFGDASVNSLGIRCAGATGRAKDNMMSGFETGMSACGDDGNVVVP